jgi:hypothetical protein
MADLLLTVLIAACGLAVWRINAAKYVLLSLGSLLLSGCLSLRLGENHKDKETPVSAEIGSVDRPLAIHRLGK